MEPPCTTGLVIVVMYTFITSVLCVPSDHMPLLLIIHLSSNIILDLVIISDFSLFIENFELHKY